METTEHWKNIFNVLNEKKIKGQFRIYIQQKQSSKNEAK